MAFPCRICNKNVNDNDHAVKCDICNFLVHIKCSNLNYIDHKYLQVNNDPWYCFSFDNNINSLLLNPSPKLTKLVNQFNNNTTDNNNIADNFIHSIYFDIDEIQKLKIPNKKNLSPYFI